MELKHYTTSEIIESIKQNPNGFDYIVFYPSSLNDLQLEIDFRDKEIKAAIEKEDKVLKMIEQVYKSYHKGFIKFLEFRKNAYEFTFQMHNYDKFRDLLAMLLKDKSVLPLNIEDKKSYSLVFRPLANADILLAPDDYKSILRSLHINYVDNYRAIFARVDRKKLLKDVSVLSEEDYPPEKQGIKPVTTFETLILYDDGKLFDKKLLIYQIDIQQGALFGFIKYLMENQKTLNNPQVTVEDLKKQFNWSNLTDLINNTNRKLRKNNSNYLIRKKGDYVYLGSANPDIVEYLFPETV